MSQRVSLAAGRGKGRNMSARLLCLILLLGRVVRTNTYLFPKVRYLAYRQHTSKTRERKKYYEVLQIEEPTNYYEQYKTAQTLNYGSGGGDSSNKGYEKKKNQKHYKQSNQERRSKQRVKAQASLSMADISSSPGL